MSNQSIQRLNYTNVSISNEALNTSKRYNGLNPRIKSGFHSSIQSKEKLNQNYFDKINLNIYKKSTKKGSNTNITRIIKNKNFNSQSNPNLCRISNTIPLKSKGTLNFSQKQSIDYLGTEKRQLNSISIENLKKFDKKSVSSESLNKLNAKSLSNQCFFRAKSTPNIDNNNYSSRSSLNQTIKLNKKEERSSQSLTSKSSNINMYESIQNLKESSKKHKIGQTIKHDNVFSFSTSWKNQKFLYYNIQEVMLSLNILSTLILLGLSIWINLDERFKVLSNFSNYLIYSSFNRLIGILPFICISVSILGFCIDLSNIVLHYYVKNFLDGHDDKIIKIILSNQKTLVQIAEINVPNKLKILKLRSKIIFTLKNTLTSVRLITFLNSSFYGLLIISTMFFVGIYLHFLSHEIINYQIPQSLIKLIREYEKQQILIINQMNEIESKIKNVATNTIEETLINKLNTVFSCCHYQNPFQFGELAPISCNFKVGCLIRLQEFIWEYLYYFVIFCLSIASFKTCIIFVLLFNYKVILVSRLFKKLYVIDIRKYRLKFKELYLEENIDLEEDDDNEIQKKEKFEKIQEIRQAKFEQLRKEEEEEYQRNQKEEMELNVFLENEKKQEAYEFLLLKQKRFEEYNYQQLQRKIQLQHFLDRKENSFED